MWLVAAILSRKRERKGRRGLQTWPAAATLNDMFAGCNSLTEPDFPDPNGLPSSTM